MKRSIGYYFLIVIKFFLISCLIYQLAIKGTYMYYKGVTAFILLELLEIFIFYKLNKNVNNLKLNFYFLSSLILNFFLINYFYYLGEKYIEILLFLSLLLFFILLYSFLLFLIEENLFYFKYTLISFSYLLFLIYLTVPIIPPKKEEISYIVGIFYIVYVLMIFLFKEVEKRNKNKLLIFINKEEKSNKKHVFNIIRILIYSLLFYISIRYRDIHYKIILFFITFELFGIMIFYKKNFFIKNLMKKIELYLLFNFFMILIFYYLGKIREEFFVFTEVIIMFSPFILALLSLIYLLIKKMKFYLIYSLILLLWGLFFVMPNLAGIPPELGEYKLSILHIFIAYDLELEAFTRVFYRNKKLNKLYIFDANYSVTIIEFSKKMSWRNQKR